MSTINNIVSRVSLAVATAFNALWLADSATSIVMAIVFAALAAKPGWATRPLVAILALVPIASAVVLYATMGAFFAGHMMLAAGAAALVGAAYKGSVTTKELRPSSI